MLEGSFLLPLLVKMLATGTVVVIASVAAERAGPMWGGLIASLPIAAGPGYVFLALEADAEFIAASALMSLAANSAIPPLLFAFVWLAPRTSAFVTVGVGLLVWLALVSTLRLWPWTSFGAVLANALTFAVCGAILRPPAVTRPTRLISRWYELPLRAALVGMVVALVVTLSRALGPVVTGIGVVFPVAFSSLAVVLHLRLGGDIAAATLGRALLPMLGFVGALLTVHLAAVPLGVWTALALALLVSLLWSAILLLRDRYRGKMPRLR
jgi:hypothetical protein